MNEIQERIEALRDGKPLRAYVVCAGDSAEFCASVRESWSVLVREFDGPARGG